MSKAYKYEPIPTAAFRKDLKSIKRRGWDIELLQTVIELLAQGVVLDEKYLDHPLKGKLKGSRGCHIAPDWVLVYKISNDKMFLYLTGTGSHADIYRM